MLQITPQDRPQIRLSEVVSALSYALDIVEGQPEGHAIRSCLIGMRLAQELELAPADRSSLFYALLLKDLGCSSNAAKVCYLFGTNEQEVKEAFKTTNWCCPNATVRYIARNVAPNGSFLDKLRALGRLALAGPGAAKSIVRIRCERGADIARHLDLTEDTVQAIRNLDEHWDGKGHPDGLRKREIPLLARILGIAQTVEVFVRRDGLDAALDMARDRSGTWFDPALVRTLVSIRADADFWTKFHDGQPRRHVAAFEPDDRVLLADDARLDRVAEAFGMVIDAKSPWTARHSQGVADIARGIARIMGLGADDVRRLGRAALLHDVGKLGVPNTILDKPGKLDAAELDEMRLHPAYTLRILERVTCFAEIADLAASHHERLDGKGYFRGLDASQLSTPARILAVADMYEALAAKRPYRADLSEGEVLSILTKQAGTGICHEAFAGLRLFIDGSGFVPYSLAA